MHTVLRYIFYILTDLHFVNILWGVASILLYIHTQYMSVYLLYSVHICTIYSIVHAAYLYVEQRVLPWRTLRPPPFPISMPGRAWGTYVGCGCCRAGTTARANALMQIVPNSSSLYTLFYSVIYNSVTVLYTVCEIV